MLYCHSVVVVLRFQEVADQAALAMVLPVVVRVIDLMAWGRPVVLVDQVLLVEVACQVILGRIRQILKKRSSLMQTPKLSSRVLVGS
jgi:hypothetical protein